MSLTDREEFKQRMENLDDEEKRIVVKTIPDELLLKELETRLSDMTNTINQMRNVLK